MGIFDIGLDEQDLYDIHTPVRLGCNSLDDSDISDSMNVKITFSFYNTELGKTRYGFDQAMERRDTKRLFKLLSRFSGKTLNELLEEKDARDDEGEALHLNRNDISGNLRSIFKDMGLNVDWRNTMIFHFALYTAKGNDASRVTGIKSPRVYFMVGQYGIMHILFYDPFHEINP